MQEKYKYKAWYTINTGLDPTSTGVAVSFGDDCTEGKFTHCINNDTVVLISIMHRLSLYNTKITKVVQSFFLLLFCSSFLSLSHIIILIFFLNPNKNKYHQ